jgi:hypothetical protein
MAISRTIGIDMPDDFPTTAYDVVNAKLGSYQQRNPNVWTQYAGGWNAIAFRFKTATVADDRFTESIKHFPQPPLEEYQAQEEAFMFFLAGFAVIESLAYALFALGAMLQPANFPMSTDDARQAIKPTLTKKKFAIHFASTPVEAALSAFLADLLADPTYKKWRLIRNALAHRTAPPRQHVTELGTGGGGGGTSQLGSTTWQVIGGLVLNDRTTSDKRKWLTEQLARSIQATESFVNINFP